MSDKPARLGTGDDEPTHAAAPDSTVLPASSVTRRRPTGRDVATAAGVSQTAVSFVLTGVHQEKISAETRRRVLAAAARLGYRPNRLARSLRTRRTDAVGLLVSTMDTVVAQAISGAQEVAWERGYHLILCNTHQSAQRERQSLHFLADLQVDGLLVLSTSNPTDNAALAEWVQTPLVLVNRAVDPKEPAWDRVIVDYETGARLAVEHLLSQGCRRPGFIGMALTGLGGAQAVRQRWQGYCAALAAAGLPLEHRRVYLAPAEREGIGWREGVEGVEQFWRLPPEQRPDGLYAINDYAAAGAIGALLQAGVRVPQEVAVVGNDDTVVASHHYPQITSVNQRWPTAGQAGLRLLLARLGPPAGEQAVSLADGPRVEIIRPQLTIRQSSLRTGPRSLSPN